MSAPKPDVLSELSWSDIHEWAGTTIVTRGQRYQRNGRVKDLARTPGGGLVAWVYGTQRYATSVEVQEGELVSTCTCPYGENCKHAVAVVLEYLEDLKRKGDVPTVTDRDERLTLLRPAAQEEVMDQSRDGDGEEEPPPASFRRPRKTTASALDSFLEGQTQAQLTALILELAERHPNVRQDLEDRRDLSAGRVARLFEAVRKDISLISAEPGWSRPWENEAHTPDYSRVRNRLEELLAKGHADEVVKLGEMVLEAGTKQVEMSDDEGETATQISSCLEVVFRALWQSSLSPAQQILWAVDAEVNDEYDLCQGTEVFWAREREPAEWNIVAEELLQRLHGYKPAKGGDSVLREYRRDQLSDWVILALEKAGRQTEIIPLCEKEAVETGNYVRLVNRLRQASRKEDAEPWLRKGIQATQKQWPGIALELRDILRRMREEESDWPAAAAFRAQDFLEEPSLKTFKVLQEAAERAGVWPPVRTVAMRYLETGDFLHAAVPFGKGQTVSQWPLPETGVRGTANPGLQHFPLVKTLIDIAIAEKRPAEVIRWYDRKAPRSEGRVWTWFEEDRVAQAVADAYPERALAVWKSLAEAHIAQTQPKAYALAAGFLRNVRRLLLKLGREEEWRNYLAALRQANVRKRRLMEILDGLSGGRIVG